MAVFIGVDSKGKTQKERIREITEQLEAGVTAVFESDAAGSDKRYAFRINSAGPTLHVFESAIDLLSYATIMKMRTGEWGESNSETRLLMII